MAENKKIIILLGGRSNLAKGLIKNKETKHFSKIILFSQTNNNAQHSEAFVQIEKLFVVSLLQNYKRFLIVFLMLKNTLFLLAHHQIAVSTEMKMCSCEH